MASSSIETNLFIDGQFVPGKAGKTFAIINPENEEKVADVSEATVEDVEIAFAAAQRAFSTWSGVPMFERIDKCLKFAELVYRDREEIAKLEAISMGLPISIYLQVISGAIAGIKHVAGLAHDIHGETSLNTPGHASFTIRQPYGVCAAIIPWNAPVFMWCGKVIPCIVAGNTIIIKSSEKAPLTSLKLASLAAEAGFPAGVINNLSGAGAVGAALASHMGIRKISFTGSTNTGKRILEAAGKSNMKRVSLETGGKNPAVIFDDADVEDAVTAVATSMQFNSGQACVSNSRIYVQKGIVDRFVEAFKKRYESVQMGSPVDPSTTFGPQADRIQFDSIMGHIEGAKADGANLVVGGQRGAEKGYFIQPTIFLNVPSTAKILKSEVFGPVVVVQQFDTEEEVVKECNDTSYGLHASVFTRDISRVYRVVKAFEAGMVTVNCSSPTFSYDLPFGGWKESGYGREMGKAALESYYEIKTVTIKL